MTMGDRIHNRRKELNLTLEYVGNYVGVAKSAVRKWETGYIENIAAARLQELENEEEALEAELAIAKASDFIITPEQIEFILWQFVEPLQEESYEDYKRRIIKCFVHAVYLYDDRLLIYYNVSRDGETRVESDIDLLGEVFDERFSGSTISIAGRTPDCEIIVLRYGFWLALDLTAQV